MSEREILLLVLTSVVSGIVLTVIFNYNVKIGYDKKLEKYCVYYEFLKNDWDTVTGRWSKYELRIIPLPLWLNFLHKDE